MTKHHPASIEESFKCQWSAALVLEQGKHVWKHICIHHGRTHANEEVNLANGTTPTGARLAENTPASEEAVNTCMKCQPRMPVNAYFEQILKKAATQYDQYDGTDSDDEWEFFMRS